MVSSYKYLGCVIDEQNLTLKDMVEDGLQLGRELLVAGWEDAEEKSVMLVLVLSKSC